MILLKWGRGDGNEEIAILLSMGSVGAVRMYC
jgi:hypothetical protein